MVVGDSDNEDGADDGDVITNGGDDGNCGDGYGKVDCGVDLDGSGGGCKDDDDDDAEDDDIEENGISDTDGGCFANCCDDKNKVDCTEDMAGDEGTTILMVLLMMIV